MSVYRLSFTGGQSTAAGGVPSSKISVVGGGKTAVSLPRMAVNRQDKRYSLLGD